MALNFEGRVWKEGRHWLIEVPALLVITEGPSRAEALRMLQDAMESLIDRRSFKVEVTLLPGDIVVLGARGAGSERLLAGFFLKRQRSRFGLTLSDMVRRLGVKSRNAYAQYEQGRCLPSLSKIQEFISAMNRDAKFVVNVYDQKAA